MADKPILFSAPMVRALLAGTKTQTRRALKSPYGTLELVAGEWRPIHTRVRIGDRLWVKETHAIVGDNPQLGDEAQACFDMRVPVYYRADDVQPELSKWRPSLFLKRIHSRLTLTVTDVRVERLQDISEADAKAEGVSDEFTDYELYGQSQPYRFGYSSLWNLINGEGAWQANPWVVAYSFSVERGNIDNLPRKS